MGFKKITLYYIKFFDKIQCIFFEQVKFFSIFLKFLPHKLYHSIYYLSIFSKKSNLQKLFIKKHGVFVEKIQK